MNPLLRLLGAAAHGLLTGQIIFSAAFVGVSSPGPMVTTSTWPESGNSAAPPMQRL
jgi:hypothetical protein